ncbi:uncharacterized protein Z518_07442 [Rhinocladiella mackenziei CBS 650.93]|uniref:Rhinocladiella mackenziei CBS 650.93 unplaced genomic scaffold supercont1.5, whole genome shotgun sequence n=1 Tax=Rhinocladiella mackenziei CBS 650.93 TaxID=1442369 RepID=A0A0D2IDI8_9EURO|nr:uncharacterized protein Z518_07442 [Rhinocladiella mackenziei CBS 650.93]KIX03889.1 hypothetical protein Z518_07442 [Rhinocladiella mackenziei CBS 650.93]
MLVSSSEHHYELFWRISYYGHVIRLTLSQCHPNSHDGLATQQSLYPDPRSHLIAAPTIPLNSNNESFKPSKLFDVSGKVALIARGRSGVGFMATQALATDSAEVYICGLNNTGTALNTQQTEVSSAEEMSRNSFDDSNETFDMWADRERTNVAQLFMTTAFLLLHIYTTITSPAPQSTSPRSAAHIPRNKYKEKISAARSGEDRDMANANLFAATNQSLNGQTVAVDDGYVLSTSSASQL